MVLSFLAAKAKRGTYMCSIFITARKKVDQYITRDLLVLDFISNSTTTALKMLEVPSVWTFIYLERPA